MISYLQHIWLAKLSGHDYEIKYKKDTDNQAIDALSRINSQQLYLMAISTISTGFPTNLTELALDLALQQLIQNLQADLTSHSKYTGKISSRIVMESWSLAMVQIYSNK